MLYNTQDFIQYFPRKQRLSYSLKNMVDGLTKRKRRKIYGSSKGNNTFPCA